jgi:arabinogalactan oligomer/maltooligosaccharide transport system substrate-binding protein
MKKRLLWIAVGWLVVSTLLLAACAAQATPTEAPAVVEPTAVPTEKPPEPTPAPTKPPEPTKPSISELTIWADELRAPVIGGLAQAFEDKYGVKIIIEQYGFGDIRDNLKIAGPAGEGPDILIGAHDWLGELTINGLLEPIDLGEKLADFAPGAIKAMTYDGQLYAVPYAVENVAFFRNPDFVPDAPETWDEVAAIAAQLEADGKVTQGYVLQQGDPYHFFPIMTAFGGYVFGLDADGNYNPNDVGIDCAGSLAAAAWLDQMVKDGHLVADIDWDTMHALFETGESAMFITGPWSLGRLRDAGANYAISDIPAGPAGEGKPFLGVQGFMVSAFSDDPLLAQAFLTEFIATEEIMQELYVVGARASAYLPVFEKTDDPDLAAFGDAGINGMPMPAIPEMSAVWTAWGDAETIVFQQQQACDDAFINAAEQIRTLIEGG